MADDFNKDVTGFNVNASSRLFSDKDPPRVRLHRLGGEMYWMTPDEAERLGVLLTEAAEFAKKNDFRSNR